MLFSDKNCVPQIRSKRALKCVIHLFREVSALDFFFVLIYGTITNEKPNLFVLRGKSHSAFLINPYVPNGFRMFSGGKERMHWKQIG